MAKSPKFRIPAEDDYLIALGRAFYTFAYMEAGFVWAIHRLGDRSKPGLLHHETGSTLLARFRKAVKETKVPIPPQLRAELGALAKEFDGAVKDRNNLLHATPGAQYLGGKGHRPWKIEDLYAAAKRFEDLCLRSSKALRDDLEMLNPAK